MSGFTYTIDLKMLGGPKVAPVAKAVGGLDKQMLGLNRKLERQQKLLMRAHIALGRVENEASISKVTFSKLNAELAKSKARTRQLDMSMQGLEGQLKDVRAENRKLARNGGNAFAGMNRNAMSLITTLGGVAFGYKSIKSAADIESIETAVDFATYGQGADTMAFFMKTTDDLKISQRAALPTFKNWLGAVRGTALEGNKAKTIFRSVAQASRVMGLDNQATAGTFVALSQMASKGKVSAEELRQQLGERLPGALGIAARAMGVTQAELNKMMEKGELYSDVFLPRFAQQLDKEFAGGVEKALGTANAKFADFDNSILALEKNLGDKLIPIGIKIVDKFLIPAVTWMGSNLEILPILGAAYLSVAAGAKAFAISNALAAMTGTGLVGVLGALNLTMLANPVFWVVAGLVAAGAGLVYLYHNSEKARGIMTGLWESTKKVGQALYEWLIEPLAISAKLLYAVSTMDLGMAKSALSDGRAWLDSDKTGLSDVVGSYQKGVTSGKSSFVGGKKLSSFLKPGAASGGLGAAPAPSGSAGSGTGGANDSKVRAGLAGIAGGGRPTTVNVMIENLGKNINVYSSSVSEGADQIADIVISRLIQGINVATQL